MDRRRGGSPPDGDVFRFVIESLDGQFAGTINTRSCDRRSDTFKYGLAIREAHQRKGYGSEAVRLVLRYFFAELRYQKCTAHVYRFTEPSYGWTRPWASSSKAGCGGCSSPAGNTMTRSSSASPPRSLSSSTESPGSDGVWSTVHTPHPVTGSWVIKGDCRVPFGCPRGPHAIF